jgi:hypothetical protein
MPHFAMHVLLAQQLAEHWSREAPFDVGDPEVRNALMHGAIAPDMGMYPGGELLISSLTHRLRTGRMVRALQETARTDTQRAYLWGWITHIIADTLLHPHINAEAARVLGRDDVQYGELLHDLTHVRVEFGLDVACLAAHPQLRETSLFSAFDGSSIGWVGDALRSTYGPVFDDASLLASHYAVVRWHRAQLEVAAYTGRRWFGAALRCERMAMRLVLPAARCAAGRFGAMTRLAALLDPIRPPGALLAAAARASHELVQLADRYLHSALVLLPDFDLEAGHIEVPDRPTATTTTVLASLAARGLSLSVQDAAAAAS